MKELVRRLALAAFTPLDRVGVHLLPKHYYSPVPDRAWLRAHPGAWRGPVRLPWDLDAQLTWLQEVVAGEVGAESYERFTARGLGLGFGLVEYLVLDGFLRSRRPQRIVEVGGGVTTGVIVEALPEASVTTIEPYPSPALRALERVKLVEEPAQLVPFETFLGLDKGDLLFIDSTHVVKTGSEVLRIYLEILPALAPGIYVHVHDVTLPYLYHRTFGRDWFDWQETSLVLALLTGSERLETLCCLSALHYARQAELRALFPEYRPQRELADGLSDPTDQHGHFPSSLWLRTR